MNVLIINTSSDLYGANRILLQTMAMLKPRKVTLLVPACGLLTEFIKNNPGFEHVQVRIINTMPLVFRKMTLRRTCQLIKNIYGFHKTIKKIKKEHPVNWVYVNTLSAFIAIAILRKLRLKILVHVHEILENDRLMTRSINQYALKWADKIIAVSKPVQLNLQVALKSNNIVTILNGIEDMFLPGTVKETAALNIILLGRIKPEKGVWFFLDAIALLSKKSIENVNFIIAGSAAPGGDYYIERLEQDIQAHPAKDSLQFKSFITDIKLLLNSSDIVVIPSLMKDPFPTTILEAASAGKPAIATNTGGAIQSVKDGITGFLIEAGNTKQFAACLQKLIQSEQLRNEMGQAARAFYLKNFTLEIFKINFMMVISDFENMLAAGKH